MMFREFMMHRHEKDHGPEFAWRGKDISRLENFSDAVFGFALTLLVVSLDVPRTLGELIETMRGFLGFALSFTLLFTLWYQHYRFFRLYGLEDKFTAVVNAVLLFVVLFYVYPLKFMSNLLVTVLTTGSAHIRMPDGHLVPMMHVSQMPLLFGLYGGGLAAVFALFALLHFHAYQKRRDLSLNAVEEHDTRVAIQHYLIGTGSVFMPFGMLQMMAWHHLAMAMGIAALPAMIQGLHHRRMRRHRSRIAAEREPAQTTDAAPTMEETQVAEEPQEVHS